LSSCQQAGTIIEQLSGSNALPERLSRQVQVAFNSVLFTIESAQKGLPATGFFVSQFSVCRFQVGYFHVACYLQFGLPMSRLPISCRAGLPILGLPKIGTAD